MIHRIYLAGCCLRIQEEGSYLLDGPFRRFTNELPFQNRINLTVLYRSQRPSQQGKIVSSAGGIRIEDIQPEKWKFSTGVESESCYLEIDREYKEGTGYFDPKQTLDPDSLIGNFMQLIRMMVECHLAYHGGVPLHASYIRHKGEAILFTAPSGTGKSTQAVLWQKRLGSKIINGDRPFLSVSPQGVRAYGVPWDGKEQLHLQEDDPVKAVIEVRQASKNSLRKLDADQAFRLLMRQSFIPMWDDVAKFSTIETIRTIARTVPFYRLYCIPEESAADLTYAVLYQNQHEHVKEGQPDMKVKEGFILRNIIDEWIVMPTGANIQNFEAAVVLNDVSAFLWRLLEKPISREDLFQAMLEEYDIDEGQATKDLDEFLSRLRELHLLLDA